MEDVLSSHWLFEGLVCGQYLLNYLYWLLYLDVDVSWNLYLHNSLLNYWDLHSDFYLFDNLLHDYFLHYFLHNLRYFNDFLNDSGHYHYSLDYFLYLNHFWHLYYFLYVFLNYGRDSFNSLNNSFNRNYLFFGDVHRLSFGDDMIDDFFYFHNSILIYYFRFLDLNLLIYDLL